MKILFDLDVLTDIACRWEEFPESLELYRKILSNPANYPCFPACEYSSLYQEAGRRIPELLARKGMGEFRRNLNLIPFEQSTAEMAQKLPLADLRDACVCATAQQAGCELIATRNVAAFEGSPIPAKTPAAILGMLENAREQGVKPTLYFST